MKPENPEPSLDGTENLLIDSSDTQFQVTLLKIWENLNSSLDLDFILTTAMKYLEEVIGAERSSIWEFDKEKDELCFRIFRGDSLTSVKEIKLKSGEGIAGQTAKTGKAIIIKDVEKSTMWSQKVDTHTQFKTRSILSVPLLYRGEVIGVIQLINKKNTSLFNDKDLSYVKMMAIPIATALVNASLYQELEQTFIETSMALADAIEKRDQYTAGHTRRVTDYAVAIAEEISMPRSEIKWLSLSGILHDIGKIGIRDNILNKQSPLTDDEFVEMKKHTIFGTEIVEKIHSLKKVISGILYHHEKFDGSGYPDGLTEEEIPLFARIIAVADTFDAMTTDRPYRKGLSVEKAFDELNRFAGKQFDPDLVKAFQTLYNRKYSQNED